MPDENREVRNSRFERHVQTVLIGIVTASIMWAGSSIHDLSKHTAVQTEKIIHLEQRVSDLADKRVDKEVFNLKIMSLEARIEALEKSKGK